MAPPMLARLRWPESLLQPMAGVSKAMMKSGGLQAHLVPIKMVIKLVYVLYLLMMVR